MENKYTDIFSGPFNNHLGQFLWHKINQWPSSTTAISDINGSWTYLELKKEIQDVSNVLKIAGVKADESVLLEIKNEKNDLAGMLGIWLAGAVAIPFHTNIPESRFKNIKAFSQARFGVFYSTSESKSKGVEKLNLSSQKHVIVRINNQPYQHNELLKDAALIVFTSGSTGKPKGVIQGHRAYFGKVKSICESLQPDLGLRVIQFLQLNFSMGQWSSFLPLALGGYLQLHKKFTPQLFTTELIKRPWDWAPLVPTMIRRWLASEADIIDNPNNVFQLKLWVLGGEPLSAFLGKTLRKKFSATGISDVYGLTETNSADFIMPPVDYDAHAGAIGFPVREVQFRITSSDRKVLGVGEIGELEVLTPFLMKGYLKLPELTEQVMNQDWFKTGDLAFTDDTGRVRLRGRKKEQINYAGVEISPLEIEEIYLSHPNIDACACTGIADKITGSAILLLYTTQDQHSISPIQLQLWAKDKIEAFKIPTHFTLVPKLPIGKTGKLDRINLKNYFSANS